MQRAQVAAEGEELDPVLGLLEVAVEPVSRQIIGRQQVAHPVRALIGRPSSTTTGVDLVAFPASLWRPLLARAGLEVQRAELIHVDDHLRVTVPGWGGPVRDGIELKDAVLLGLVVGIGRGLPRLDGLETRRSPHGAARGVLRGRCRRPPP